MPPLVVCCLHQGMVDTRCFNTDTEAMITSGDGFSRRSSSRVVVTERTESVGCVRKGWHHSSVVKCPFKSPRLSFCRHMIGTIPFSLACSMYVDARFLPDIVRYAGGSRCPLPEKTCHGQQHRALHEAALLPS